MAAIQAWNCYKSGKAFAHYKVNTHLNINCSILYSVDTSFHISRILLSDISAFPFSDQGLFFQDGVSDMSPPNQSEHMLTMSHFEAVVKALPPLSSLI